MGRLSILYAIPLMNYACDKGCDVPFVLPPYYHKPAWKSTGWAGQGGRSLRQTSRQRRGCGCVWSSDGAPGCLRSTGCCGGESCAGELSKAWSSQAEVMEHTLLVACTMSVRGEIHGATWCFCTATATTKPALGLGIVPCLRRGVVGLWSQPRRELGLWRLTSVR
jgi:hypothetical protein